MVQQGKKKVRIALDCGHGGVDAGYVAPTIQEKQLTLIFGLLLAPLLQQEGYEVILTRTKDETVSLSERVNKAHAAHADLFLSLHANGDTRKIEGIETFYSDHRMLKTPVDHLDKKTKLHALQLVKNRSIASKLLADNVQNAVVAAASTLYPGVRNRGARSGSCQVLMGFQGPAALIEVGYLTAAHEGALLQTSDYQNEVARGICKGIKRFVDKHFA